MVKEFALTAVLVSAIGGIPLVSLGTLSPALFLPALLGAVIATVAGVVVVDAKRTLGE